ncbi:MAG TPA: TonB-dependent receptor [Steroidobacteraceae bacterium]|jgi:outer membrane receptor protein involved in Fe transport|nr:TonB-dependent receptor [Steroidobacteraceae bacterium]
MKAATLHTTALVLGVLLFLQFLPDAEGQTVQQAAAVPPTQTDAAQQQATSLQEVVVTAQRRSENLQQVPITVSVANAQTLEASGISSTTQIAQAFPGVSTRVTYNQLEPFIRGIGTQAAGPGIENSVALYVDGVYYGSQVATAFSLIDVDQVAVLKGPQGTLFGRNATGGVIQVTTRQPSQETSGVFRVSYDNYKTGTADAYITGGISQNLAASFTARYSAAGEGWGRNIATGHENHQLIGDEDFHAKLKYTPDDVTSIYVNGDWSKKTDTLGPNFVPVYPQYTTSLLPGYRSTQNPWDNDSHIDNRNRFVADGVSMQVDRDLAPVRLVSISSYRADHLTNRFDSGATPTPGLDILIDEVTDQYTQEFQVISKPGQWMDWQTGVFYYRGWGVDDPITAVIYPAFTGGPQINVVTRTRETTESAAAYFQGTKEIVQDTKLTVGLRYTWEQRNFRPNQGTYIGDILIATLPQPTYPLSQTVKKPTWRLALDHQFTTDVMGYVSYNRGFKSGGYNTHAADNPPYAPETLDAYEIGSKTEWLEHRLRINAAAFYYDYKNVQVAKYTTTSLIYNGAKARIYGIDLDTETRIGRNLQVTAGVEWLHARYTDFPLAPFSTPVLGGGALLYYASAAGNTLNNAPNITATVRLEYNVPIPVGSLNLTAANSYSSRFYQDPDNFLRQPAYNLISGSFSWTSSNDRVMVRFFGNNLLNKAVATQLSTLPVPPIGYLADYASPPRTYGVSMQYKF